MKLILSRKGMDSSAGKMPSPILPDGTLLSLPIPHKNIGVKYDDISYGNKSYAEIIRELKPSFDFDEYGCCHLDPDIRADIDGHPSDWKPAFGQCDASATLLDNQGVDVGDIFLFFGWFKQTEYDTNGKLRFVRGAKDLHIIYGYMQVGSIVKGDDINSYNWHPHAKKAYKNNRLYIPSDTLSFADNVMGYGVLEYDKKNVLTKEGYSRSRWNMPKCFNPTVKIAGCGDCFKEDYFQSPGRGQEMVFDVTDEIMDWIKTIVL